MRVERTIEIYLIDQNEPSEEINVDAVPFETLEAVVGPKADDPLLYDGYVLNGEQIDRIDAFLGDKQIAPDFTRYHYILVCAGIYDWGGRPKHMEYARNAPLSNGIKNIIR